MIYRGDGKSFENSGWSIVYVANSSPEAHVIKGRLEANGIPSWTHQESIGAAYGFMVGPLAEVKVLVAERDYQRALDILNEDVDEDDLSDEFLDEDDDE